MGEGTREMSEQEIPLSDQIKCVGREVGLRKNIYPSMVAKGKMTEEAANAEIVRMEAVLETLKSLEEGEESGPHHGE